MAVQDCPLREMQGVVPGTVQGGKVIIPDATNKRIDALDVTALKVNNIAQTPLSTANQAAVLKMLGNNTFNTPISAETGVCSTNGITEIGHVDALTAVTLAAPSPGERILVRSITAYAHTVTSASGVFFSGNGGNGTSHRVATFHNTGDEWMECVYESATVWRVVQVSGVTFA
jgi:hypothetical protein